MGNASAPNLILGVDPAWLLLGAGPGSVSIWTKHLPTTLEKLHALENCLIESCRNLGSKGQRLFCARSDYPHKKEHLYLQICPPLTAFECVNFLYNWLPHIILKQKIMYNISLAEISRMKYEVNIPFSFVYLNGHILLLSAKPSPSFFLWSNYKWNKLLIPLSIILRSMTWKCLHKDFQSAYFLSCIWYNL